MSLGVQFDDGGAWVRRTCMVLAKNTYTPLPFWLDVPFVQIHDWIGTNNELIAESKKQ